MREQGINITSAKEEGHGGKPDPFHAAHAFKERRFLLTRNGKHFLDDCLVPFRQVHGIIVVTGSMADMAAYARVLSWIVSDIVPGGDIFVGSKIELSEQEMVHRFIDYRGQRVTSRVRRIDGKLYEWVEDDETDGARRG